MSEKVTIHPIERISLYTQVRVPSYEMRGAIGAMLAKARYKNGYDFNMAFQANHSEYNGYLVEVVAKEYSRHAAILAKIRKYLLATCTSYITEDTVKIYQ